MGILTQKILLMSKKGRPCRCMKCLFMDLRRDHLWMKDLIKMQKIVDLNYLKETSINYLSKVHQLPVVSEGKVNKSKPHNKKQKKKLSVNSKKLKNKK